MLSITSGVKFVRKVNVKFTDNLRAFDIMKYLWSLLEVFVYLLALTLFHYLKFALWGPVFMIKPSDRSFDRRVNYIYRIQSLRYHSKAHYVDGFDDAFTSWYVVELMRPKSRDRYTDPDYTDPDPVRSKSFKPQSPTFSGRLRGLLSLYLDI